MQLYGCLLILCFSGCVAASTSDIRSCDVDSLGYQVIEGVAVAVPDCQVPHPVVSGAKVCVEPCLRNVSVEWEGWRGYAVTVPAANCSGMSSMTVHVGLGSVGRGAGRVLVAWGDDVGKGMLVGRVERGVW